MALDDFDYLMLAQTFGGWFFGLFHWRRALVLYGLSYAFKVGVCETLKIGSVLISVCSASIAQPSGAAAS